MMKLKHSGATALCFLLVAAWLHSDTRGVSRSKLSIPGTPGAGPLWQRIDSRKDPPKALVYFPTLVVGTAVVYHLPNIDRPLCLTGEALAGIFSGQINRWNDERILTSNAGLKLPNTEIRVFTRNDKSGTTQLLTEYLSKVSPAWFTKVGASEWPNGTSVHDEAHMIANIRKMPFSIGFADFYSAKEAHVSRAALRNPESADLAPAL
jgi:phosphate transport system substrate-binding protein